MKDLQQRPTPHLDCGEPGEASTVWILPPPAVCISYKPEMVGEQYGWVNYQPGERWNRNWNSCYVLTECQGWKYPMAEQD